MNEHLFLQYAYFPTKVRKLTNIFVSQSFLKKIDSEYELKRKLNMEENQNLLMQLGLNAQEGIAAVRSDMLECLLITNNSCLGHTSS